MTVQEAHEAVMAAEDKVAVATKALVSAEAWYRRGKSKTARSRVAIHQGEVEIAEAALERARKALAEAQRAEKSEARAARSAALPCQQQLI